jgi:hypothetical protein
METEEKAIERKFLEEIMGFVGFTVDELKVISDNLGNYDFDKETNTVTVDLPNITVYISKRPSYCNRGRYDFWVEAKENKHQIITIDFSDAFPRYFFRLQGAMDEIKEYLSFNLDDIANTLDEKTAVFHRIVKAKDDDSEIPEMSPAEQNMYKILLLKMLRHV